jgi:NodT family efflux transporter outer membrane factor (OMF) lipoprotein
LTLAAGTGLLLAGCQVGPDYTPPVIQAPDTWAAPEQGGIPGTGAVAQQWWKQLNDPILEQLVAIAVEQNLDLKEWRYRIAEARALRGVTASGLWPNVDADGSASRTRNSGNGNLFGGNGTTTTNLRAGFDAGWEIDVFGRVSRDIQAAEATIDAAEESRRDTLVTVMAEVARNYVEYRSFQQRVEIARKNARTQSESLKLSDSRFKAGLTSELDVARGRALVATTEAAIPTLEAAKIAAANRIAVLLGKAPGSFMADLDAPKDVPMFNGDLGVGLPADLVRRRPDIRRSERELAAATARIGVATADLYPRFSLTGSFGIQSRNADDLYDAQSRFWSIGPSVKWPIFEAGRIRSNIMVTEARTEQAMVRYERAVLGALEEVENAMVGTGRERIRRTALLEAVSANRRSVELATELYSKGLTDYLSVLDAQRQLFSSEDQLADADRNVTERAIALYKALGGGWEEVPLPADPDRTNVPTPSWVPAKVDKN